MLKFAYLITEDGRRVSLGRITFWLLLCFMIYFWFIEGEVPESLFSTWWLILLYNFGKKAKPVLEKMIKRKQV